MAITFGSYSKNKGSIPFRATNLNAYLRGSLMRDYNFRQKAVIKEQKKRKWLWNSFYWPSMPNKKVDENGKQYFIEGKTGAYKKFLKNRLTKL